MRQKRACVAGAGGFIGGHLVKRLKSEGYWIRGVDYKKPSYRETFADEFLILDLTKEDSCLQALILENNHFDEVYQLAAQMGGMGFISSHECEIMHDSNLINIHMIHTAARLAIPRYFFSSSVCVYPDMDKDATEVKEENVYPANPDNEYGWEKLFTERLIMAYGRQYGIKIRIARFQNCIGPYGTWRGGKEKFPAALCRKIAEVEDGGEIEVWGDGSAIRSYVYVEDLVDGVFKLMQSDIDTPTNLGNSEYLTVNNMVEIVAEIANKKISVKHIDGPVGVHSRNFSNEKIYSLGWKPKFSLREGLSVTYQWIKEQVEESHA